MTNTAHSSSSTSMTYGIAIPRALYNRPPILLFDEATSSPDSESERAVKESLDELMERRGLYFYLASRQLEL